MKRTVLITGASSGLGYEFAKLFANDGADLVLVARRVARLEEIAADLGREHRTHVATLGMDLSDPAAPEAIARTLEERGIEVDVLVNSAGMGVFGKFTETPAAAELALIQVNVTALTHLTKLVLPGMVRRGFGRVLNVASTAAFQPGPLMAVYYAAKAYVLSFSEAIASELAGTGVTVTALCPGPTATDFHSTAEMDVGALHSLGVMMDGSTVARIGYRALVRGKRVVIPGLGNRLVAQVVRFAPRRLVTRVVRGLQDRLVGRTAS